MAIPPWRIRQVLTCTNICKKGFLCLAKSQTARNAFKLSKTAGHHFEICWSQTARNALKLSKTAGENFEICWSQTAINALNLSKTTGEHFEIC